MGSGTAIHRNTCIARLVRERIIAEGEKLWRLEDFRDLPMAAVAQALSRLAKSGLIERLSKGIYYRTRETAFGKSLPSPSAIQQLAARRGNMFPSGITAANLLGFTSQTSRRSELATSAPSLPRKLVGQDAVIHTRRPEGWSKLSPEDAALLDFLRRGGKTSELSPVETVRRTLALLGQPGRCDRLLTVLETEPPRVRALFGALGERLGLEEDTLERLRKSLNPFSRFEFGLFAGLPNARHWQAKDAPRHATL